MIATVTVEEALILVVLILGIIALLAFILGRR